MLYSKSIGEMIKEKSLQLGNDFSLFSVFVFMSFRVETIGLEDERFGKRIGREFEGKVRE